MNKERLLRRAYFKTQIRALLATRGVIEVDVPLLYPKVCPDHCVEPLSLHFMGTKLYLQPSPELNLKKIVAREAFDCYSLNYAYRADPGSPQHHPEFLMLELYLIGERYEETQSLTVDLLRLLLGDQSVRIQTYQEAWQVGLDEPYSRDHKTFSNILLKREIPFEKKWGEDLLEDLVFGTLIQPTLGQNKIDIIDGFPLHQSALAVVVTSDRAARYEVFIEGMEVANGYNELSGGAANAERFRDWQEKREQDGLDRCDPLDLDFFEAMDRLPACSGVAIGLDRVLMLALQCSHLKDSIPFYWI
jgi:lysyl-tRNA synthetase class 2